MKQVIMKEDFIYQDDKAIIANEHLDKKERDERVFREHAASGKFGGSSIEELEALLEESYK